jgi:hypothetical protein
MDPSAPFTFYKNHVHAQAAAQAVQYAYFAEVRRKQKEEGVYSTTSKRATTYFESEHLAFDQFPTPVKYHEEMMQYKAAHINTRHNMVKKGAIMVGMFVVMLVCLYHSPLVAKAKERVLESQIHKTLVDAPDGDSSHLSRLERKPM